jgi:hypothetical protein
MMRLLRVSGAWAVVLVLASVAPVAAQSEGALKEFFEGRQVTLRIDMPGSSDGVDLHVDSSRSLNTGDYSRDLKRYGVAIRASDSVVVTLVKVKKDLIEFQLGGGGFGTFGDDTSTSVYIPTLDKSEREKFLERRVREEDDQRERRNLQRELDDLRDRRERENRRILAERERESEVKRERVMEERLHGGSRFNLRYSPGVPGGIRPEEIMAALSEYVDFGGLDRSAAPPPPPAMRAPLPTPQAPPSGDFALPRKGMLRAEAERMYGRPAEVSERRDGSATVVTLIFLNGDQRITAEFVEDVLIRYTLSSK